MEQKKEKTEREFDYVLDEKLEELQGLIGKYKEAHHTEEELKRIEKIESSLEASLETLYELAGILEVPVSLEKVQGKGQFLSYSGAANALFSDYEVIYYVNAETGHYVEYSAQGNYEQLRLEKRGTDFFSDLYRNIKKVVYEKDQEYVANALSKESIFSKLKAEQVFSVRYRLMIGGKPMYYQSRVVYSESGEYIIIGICSADRLKDGSSTEEDLDFANIARALTSDYDRIYYVNMEDESYIRYTTDKGSELKASSSGSSFFEVVQKITANIIYKKDADRLREVFQKKRLVEELKRREMLSMTYRILIKGVPSYHHLKAFYPDGSDFRHVFVCVGNIDEQIQKEMKFIQKKNLTYTKIAETLSKNYFSIYYVDIITGYYMEYTSNSALRSLEIINSGEDFFADCQTNIPKQICPKDVEMVLLAFQKEKMMKELEKSDSLVLTYRLLLRGIPTYVSTKVTRIDGDPGHILVGINNVDVQVRSQKKLEKTLKELKKSQTDKLTFLQIALTLSKDYFSVYYVDLKNDHYIEYNSRDEYKELDIEKKGENFFREMREKMRETIYKEDKERILTVFTKRSVLEEIEKGHPFTISYRLMFQGTPVYVSMKVDYLDDRKDSILVGISSIDAQMRREMEYAKALKKTRELVDKDPLTGTKSKHAYKTMEEKLNRRITAKIPVEFAIVVCDVNNLKVINDTLGHKAGDHWIKNASHMICSIFKRSPVFRIGGDEFVVVLQGQDYQNREKLLNDIRNRSKTNKEKGEVVVASGISHFDEERDHTIEDVFERADDEMYKNKVDLKEDGEEIR